MKSTIQGASSERGSVLVITVCTAFVIGLSLISYLLLVQSQNRMVFRSQQWNLAMAHAEAGVEEALAQLNYKFGTNLINKAANGWGGPADGVYGPVQRKLRTGAYQVTISTDYPSPVIVSRGYATNAISGDTVVRTVRVNARSVSAFQLGMAAKLDIDFKGQNVHIDSFDSADLLHDDPMDPNEVKANGDIASTDGWVNVQNANINGKIKTGPGGSYDFGPNGWAGPIGWAGPGLYSPDWYENDFNADFKDVDPPFSAAFALPPTPGSGLGAPLDTNHWVLANGDYFVNGDVQLASKSILVQGQARLWITGNFKLNSGCQINIEDGATLKLYVGTPTGADVSALLYNVNGGSTSKAANFQYFGLPTNKALEWAGNKYYKGTVYAPQATFTLGGGGNDVYDYQGACVIYEVKMNGHFNFHYDEDLKRKDPVSGYAAGSWREI